MANPDAPDDDGPRDLSVSSSFTPAPMPPRAPDGGPLLEAAPVYEPTPAGQGMCEGGPLGPCANYHRLVISFDAARPFAKVVSDTEEHLELGPDDGEPMPGAMQTHHTCYPAPGVELDLSGHHVFECNFYRPIPPSSLVRGRHPLMPPSSPPPAAPRSAGNPKKRRSGRRK